MEIALLKTHPHQLSMVAHDGVKNYCERAHERGKWRFLVRPVVTEVCRVMHKGEAASGRANLVIENLGLDSTVISALIH